VTAIIGDIAAAGFTAARHAAAERLDAALGTIDAAARPHLIRQKIDGSIRVTTSFGLEDQVLTHLITQSGIEASFVTLDTGRLFPETYDVWSRTETRYGIRVRAFYPDGEAAEDLVDRDGIDGFYHSLDARKACCGARKVAPLARALRGAAAWITGLRADQSDHRQGLGFAAYDTARNLVKINPLLDWPRERVAAFAAAENIPVNRLHERGFLSIGCAPCTRAVRPGEPERAGRWWWEDEAAKECGLHVTPDGRLTRARVPELAS